MGDHSPPICHFPERDNDRPSVRTVEGSVHFVEAVQEPSHLKQPQPIPHFYGVVAGKTRHVVPLVVRIAVLIGLFGAIQFVDEKEEVLFFELLPVDERSLADP